MGPEAKRQTSRDVLSVVGILHTHGPTSLHFHHRNLNLVA